VMQHSRQHGSNTKYSAIYALHKNVVKISAQHRTCKQHPTHDVQKKNIINMIMKLHALQIIHLLSYLLLNLFYGTHTSSFRREHY